MTGLFASKEEKEQKEFEKMVKEDDETRKKIRQNDLENRIEEYNSMYDKSNVIQFKNERIAILAMWAYHEAEFIIAFDDLVKEGYKLRTSIFEAPLGAPKKFFLFHKD